MNPTDYIPSPLLIALAREFHDIAVIYEPRNSVRSRVRWKHSRSEIDDCNQAEFVRQCEGQLSEFQLDEYVVQLWRQFPESKLNHVMLKDDELSRVIWRKLTTATPHQRAIALAKVRGSKERSEG